MARSRKNLTITGHKGWVVSEASGTRTSIHATLQDAMNAARGLVRETGTVFIRNSRGSIREQLIHPSSETGTTQRSVVVYKRHSIRSGVRKWRVREEPTSYESDPQLPPLDGDILFELLGSVESGFDARRDAALELASRAAERTRLTDFIINCLAEAAPDSESHQLCIGLAEELHVEDSNQRQRLAEALFVSARALDDAGISEVAWSAIRRWGSLVPASELRRLLVFLDPTNQGETIQCTFDTLWHALSVHEHPGAVLAPLADRALELARKGLDPDWQIVPLASSISICATLAFFVLSQDASSLESFCHDLCAAPHFPLDLVQVDVESALHHAERHDVPALPRLRRVHALLAHSDS